VDLTSHTRDGASAMLTAHAVVMTAAATALQALASYHDGALAFSELAKLKRDYSTFPVLDLTLRSSSADPTPQCVFRLQ